MTIKDKTYQSPLKPQTNRIAYLDFARGLAILFMIMQHTMLVHEINEGEGGSILGGLFVLLGTAPAAPVFMVIMGIFIARSKASTRINVFRGIKILLAGYLLNFLRFVLPLSLLPGHGDKRNMLLEVFFEVDIFHLAGLSIISLALIKNIPYKKIVLPLFCLAILLVSPCLWGINDNILTQIFWGTNHATVHFPFFPWVIYPTMGFALSEFFVSFENKKNRIRSILIAFFLSIVGGATIYIFPFGDGYARTGLSMNLIILGFVFLWLPICFSIVNRLNFDNKILKLLSFWSVNVTAIYMIQWILYGWSILVFDINNQTDIVAILIGIGVLLTTHFLVKSKRIGTLFAWI